ncbi:unnamed protein product [Adineta steineri]|uniref:Tudor domain-containing protein n=1 Tax=Adineta steineri TaxID=433720 RepID=A0A814LJ41_9BILA|nr:unnamed protein product [Adineta steineri]CAF1064312.1 unnamed protein product [Adineta steineri]
MSNNIFLKNSNEFKKPSPSPLTEFADSGVASRFTPLSSANNRKLNTNHDDDDDYQSISTEYHSVSSISKPELRYKTCVPYMQYSNCLITYLDHPSAIFIQIGQDGERFQQMHQDLNRYYMDNINSYSNISTNIFNIGDFCVAYSTRYFEFFRARILNIDHANQQFLIIYVDFGNSEWVHIKSIRPLHTEFAELEIQCIPVTLSHILPKKDSKTGSIEWNTATGKECTRRLRRLLIKPESEPFLFVSVIFLSNEMWWPLPFVDIKVDGQDLAEILHNDGFARLTRNNKELRMIYPNFGNHPNEHLIFNIQSSKQIQNRCR